MSLNHVYVGNDVPLNVEFNDVTIDGKLNGGAATDGLNSSQLPTWTFGEAIANNNVTIVEYSSLSGLKTDRNIKLAGSIIFQTAGWSGTVFTTSTPLDLQGITPIMFSCVGTCATTGGAFCMGQGDYSNGVLTIRWCCVGSPLVQGVNVPIKLNFSINASNGYFP